MKWKDCNANSGRRRGSIRRRLGAGVPPALTRCVFLAPVGRGSRPRRVSVLHFSVNVNVNVNLLLFI